MMGAPMSGKVLWSHKISWCWCSMYTGGEATEGMTFAIFAVTMMIVVAVG
jgi:hypothetical protein